jgi:membrane protease YdiL (CAAX protease family)
MLSHGGQALRGRFLFLASAFEGSLVLIALGLGWLLSVDPLAHWAWNGRALAWGLAGTVPLYLLFVVSYRTEHSGLKQIRELLLERLGPYLAACNAVDLLYLGMLAGVTEEILFRGVLQPWFEGNWGWLGGLVFSNLVFALAHWVTPLYGLLAGLTGAYLGWSMDFSGERNLVVPVLIHGIYDFLAFTAVAKHYARSSTASGPD